MNTFKATGFALALLLAAANTSNAAVQTDTVGPVSVSDRKEPSNSYPESCRFDLNHDGAITAADVDFALRQMTHNYIPGIVEASAPPAGYSWNTKTIFLTAQNQGTDCGAGVAYRNPTCSADFDNDNFISDTDKWLAVSCVENGEGCNVGDIQEVVLGMNTYCTGPISAPEGDENTIEDQAALALQQEVATLKAENAKVSAAVSSSKAKAAAALKEVAKAKKALAATKKAATKKEQALRKQILKLKKAFRS